MNVDEYNAQVAANMSEAQLQRLVMALAAACGWTLRYHTHDSRRSDKGFPDCVFLRGERLVFAELKSQKGRVRPEQVLWLDALRDSTAEAYLWRPSDWLAGDCERVLQ